MTRIQHVIFDLDGLIVDTEPLHRRSFNHLMRFLHIEHQFSAQEYGTLFTGRSIFENAEYVRERYGLAQTAEQLTAAHSALFNLLIADAENLELMPGLPALLDALEASQVTMAIASSSRPEQIKLVVRGLNLHTHFAAMVGNDGTLKPKPAPDVYLRALEQLGAGPETTIALEDSNSGVRAARSAGLDVIAVPNEYTRNQDMTPATRVMANLDEVRKFLAAASVPN